MIENQQVYIVYIADGVQTQWDFPYHYVEASEIELFIEHNGEVSKIDPTLYSFDEDTKKVTYPLPLDANFSESLEPLPPVPQGDSVLLWRNTAITQEEDSSNTNFKSPDVERMVDKLTAICQELSTLLGRTVRYNPVVPDNEMETDALKFVEGINQSMQVAQEAAEDAEDAAGLAEQAAAQAQAAEQAVDGAIRTHNQDSTAHPSIQQHLGTIDGQIVELQNTKYAADIDLSINSSTFVVTANLKDQDGNVIGTAKTIDLPLESVVVSGSYDDTTKKVVLTLQNGSTVEFSVADLVAGLQSEITSSNKLSADLVDDTSTTHKFVTASDKSTWNGKQDAINDLATIRSGAAAGATALQPNVAASTYATKEEIAEQYTESNLIPKSPVAFEKVQLTDFYTEGSPTIVDGVISGITSSDVVRTSQVFPSSFNEIDMVFKVSEDAPLNGMSVCCWGSRNDLRRIYANSGTIALRAENNDLITEIPSSAFSYNTYAPTGFYVGLKVTKQDNGFLYTLSASADKNNWVSSQGTSTADLCGSQVTWFLTSRSGTYNGKPKIDLKETCIKVNGEYLVPPLFSTVVSVSTMTGATSSAAGASGLVPAPAAGDETKFLRGDGTWVGSTSSVAWGAISGTLSDQTDLQTALNAKAIDSDVVHKTGAETIAGNKTFADNIVLYKHSPILLEVSTDITRGTYVDNAGEIKLIAWDKNSNLLSELRTYVESNGNTSFCIGVCSQDENDTQIYKTVFRGTTRKDGQSEISMTQNAVVYAPTPAASNNSTQVATTAFVKSQTHLIETYVNGTSWYNVWEIHNPSTGALIGKWCEQGGRVQTPSHQYGQTTVDLLKTMADKNYSITLGGCNTTMNGNYCFSVGSDIEPTYFIIFDERSTGRNHTNDCYWVVKGYMA